MKYTVRFDVAAEADLRKIYLYLLGEAGERVATTYVDQIVDYCSDFETFPERGTRHSELSRGLRIVGYRRKATIAFRVDENIVTIMRIFHRGQNVIFSDEPENG